MLVTNFLLHCTLLSSSDGFVTCVEVMEADESRGRVAATNVFERQDGKWRITHHHGSPAPPLLL